jgi:hypothetical protein
MAGPGMTQLIWAGKRITLVHVTLPLQAIEPIMSC